MKIFTMSCVCVFQVREEGKGLPVVRLSVNSFFRSRFQESRTYMHTRVHLRSSGPVLILFSGSPPWVTVSFNR